MQRPSEWPLWYDDDRHGGQLTNAPLRHDVALARYLEKQRAHRAAAGRGPGLSIVAANAGGVASRVLQWSLALAGRAVERIDEVGMNLSKAHREFSTPRKHR